MGYILTVTLNASVDTTLTLPTAFTLGETNRVGAALKLPGGKGINVARVLHTMGVPVHVTGFVGGPTAAFIRNGLLQAGMNATFLPIAGTSRTCTAVVECESHRVTEINEPGPTITAPEAQAFLELYEALLPEASAVVLSGTQPPGLPDNYYALLLKRAHAAHVASILDTSGSPFQRGIVARPLLVKPNAMEARQLLGKEVRRIEDAVGVGQSMRQQGAQMAVITRGADGAVLVTEKGVWLARLSVARSISSVGSGDAFVAGFIAGLQYAVESGEKASIAEAAAVADIVERALILAVACGAANTLLLGAGVLTREDVECFRHRVDMTMLA